MLGEHAKREMVTSEKPEASGKKNDEHTPSKEVGDKHKEHKEELVGSIKSHRKGDNKKKKMKKVVYYETDSSSPSTSGAESHLQSAKSVRSTVRCLFAILTFLNALLYFMYPLANHHIFMVRIIVCGMIK
jgi:hypothetical protein